MKIFKSKKLKDTESRVLLVRKGEDLSALIPDGKQRQYVEQRFARDKESAQLNLLDHHLFVRRLENGEGTIGRILEEARTAAHAMHASINDLGIKTLVVVNGGVTQEESIAFAEGLALTNYHFLKYKTGENKKANALEDIGLLDKGLSDDHILKLKNLLDAVYMTRDLVNEPLSYLTAVQLASEIEQMGKEAGFTVEVFNQKKIESLKRGGLLAVNRGSIDPPTFSVLTHKPAKASNKKPIILVGKGVVYDTGGLSLKPTHDSMDYMKCDMGGAAAVAGALYAVAKNQFPLWVVGWDSRGRFIARIGG